jgi:SnoaL-like domain
MTDQDAVLAANLEFYRAFAARDLAAMDALWAQRAPVACLHPGWTALKDRDAIIESWAGILSNPGAPRISCFDEHAFLYGDVWRIAHHHAGQIVRRQAERRPPSRLN